MDNLRVVFFTNQNNYKIAEISVEYFKKNSKKQTIDIVSNKFTQSSKFKHNDVQYLDMNVDWKYDGSHFGESMIKYLNTIDDDYIFFFCDDYIVIKEIQEEKLERLMDFIICEDVDYFGFDYMNPGDTNLEEKVYQSKCPNEYSDNFIVRNKDHRYLYSVQSCIWKKESLLKILSNDTSLHNLDYTIDKLRTHNNIKALGNNLNSYATYMTIDQVDILEYYILCYVEIVRHGKFILPENDPMRKEKEIQTKIIRDIIEKNMFTNSDFFNNLYNTPKVR
jgi:hypothetical protein